MSSTSVWDDATTKQSRQVIHRIAALTGSISQRKHFELSGRENRVDVGEHGIDDLGSVNERSDRGEL
jgi:hypothetical protein